MRYINLLLQLCPYVCKFHLEMNVSYQMILTWLLLFVFIQMLMLIEVEQTIFIE